MKPLSRPLSLLRAATPWRATAARQPFLPAFRAVLDADGLRGAVRLLNARVPHRYTAVHRLVIDQVASLAIHDLEGADVAEMQVPVDRGHSFCQYAIADGHFFTEDSVNDRRLDGHVAQGRIAAYHGLALVDPSGRAFGSLCHFDLSPRFLSEAAFKEMSLAAVEIARHLARQSPDHAPSDLFGPCTPAG